MSLQGVPHVAAFHEAGHAVVAVHLGMLVTEVNIVSNPLAGYGGFTQTYPVGKQSRAKRILRAVARKCVLITFAGPEADLKHTAVKDTDPDFCIRASKDVQLIHRLDAKYGVLKQFEQAGFDRLRRKAARLVELLWPSIGTFAECLIASPTMDRYNVREAVERAGLEYPALALQDLAAFVAPNS